MLPRFFVLVFFAGLMTLQAATIILVRHAEKAGPTGDVPLSESGVKRAALLAKMLAQSKVTAIYTSEYKRTKSTAAPLAQLLSIEPRTFSASDVDGLVSVLKAAPLNAVILVVTHSDRLPILAERLGVTVKPVAETEYSRLLILNVSMANTTSLTLRFGEILE